MDRQPPISRLQQVQKGLQPGKRHDNKWRSREKRQSPHEIQSGLFGKRKRANSGELRENIAFLAIKQKKCTFTILKNVNLLVE